MDLHLHQEPALFHLSCIAHQYWTAGGQIVNNPVMTVVKKWVFRGTFYT